MLTLEYIEEDLNDSGAVIERRWAVRVGEEDPLWHFRWQIGTNSKVQVKPPLSEEFVFSQFKIQLANQFPRSMCIGISASIIEG